MGEIRTTYLDPDYRKTPDTSCVFCIRCQKPIKAKNYRMVNLANDGFTVIHPADSHKVLDSMDWFAIGNDCAKQIGLEFSHLSTEHF